MTPVSSDRPAPPAPDHETPAELLAAVQAGSPGAWDRLVARYERMVYAVPRGQGLSDADAEEVFQATWIALYRQIPLIRKPSALPSWIITTAQRQAWRLRRKGSRDEQNEDVDRLALADDAAGPHEDALALERQQLVREALSELGGRCQALLEQLYLAPPAADDSARSGPSYEAVAQALGMAVGSIGPTRQRCLAELAKILERRGLQ